MDNPVKSLLQNLNADPQVTGVVAADANGLCLAVAGDGNEHEAGFAYNICTLAKDLNDSNQNGDAPSIRIETKQRWYDISHADGNTVVLHKKPSNQ